jgi:hypothetical protein
MSVVSQWIANGPSGFGPRTQALLATQNPTQVAEAGVVVSQAFLSALIDAATNSGSA